MEKGYLSLILHAHLPFVRHPEYDEFLEEDWLFEAITETYIPLIHIFEKLIEDKVHFKIAMSITPPLISMLIDPLLQSRYLRHLDRLIELADKEIRRTAWQPEFNRLSLMYHHRFTNARHTFANRYNCNIINAFKAFQDRGVLEIITCGATHGYLPLMEVHKKAVRAQVKVAAALHQKVFGKRPFGIWLPECGYNPGDDEELKEESIRYFITDTHGILFGSPRPKFGVYAPVYCRSGVAAFGRDMESSKSVWSAIEGYPGDYDYREFYRDIGFDLDYDYVSPYINPDGIRINTGIKYYRITGMGDDKQPYDPDRARQKAAEHAGNFMFNREKQAEYLYDIMGRRPIIISPYDAELYGHWWFEGPLFLDFLIRKLAYDQKTIRLITPSEYFSIYPKNQVSTPSMSSWGYKGYSEVWLCGENDWIYRHLHKATERMVELARQNPDVYGLTRRGLNQMARELLLMQSSDWAFIMKTGSFVSYAIKRIRDHLYRFTRLYDEIKSDGIDESFLADLEQTDNIFPEIDYRVYS